MAVSSGPPGPDVGGRVVVTGGCGFVGRAVVAALRARDAGVTVVDRQPYPGNDPGVRSVVGELTDPQVQAAALDGPVAGVVHLAAKTSVLRTVAAPAETFDANVVVTAELLEGCRLRGIERFVFSSTNAVVGDVGHATMTEQAPLRPLTPYGASKAACEMLLSGYAGAYGMAACALRFTNIYGPGMGHKDNFVPRMMRAVLSGTGVQIYGDGLQCRDLVHIDDVVTAVLAAFDRRYAGTVIIGSGESVTVLEMVEAVRSITGAALPVRHVAPKPGEMPAVIVDISRARAELDYAPSMSLTEGLATVWQYFAALGDDAAGTARELAQPLGSTR